MLKILLKKQLTEIYRAYFYNAKKNTARSKAATAAYLAVFVLLMVGVIGGMFTYLSVSICGPLADAGMLWFYFALMGLIAVFLGTFGSVFNTYSGLYLAKDNDLLLSMPIPVNAIMAARLLSVYLMGLMYSAVVMLPAVIVYWIVIPVGVGAVFSSLLLVLLISVFVLTLSCALGWVVAKVSLKLKNKSFITVFISLLFFGAYYFVYFKAQTAIRTLVENAALYGEKIIGSAYPVYLFGKAGTGDPAAVAIVSAVVLALFALMWLLLSRSFLKITTATGKTERKAYKASEAKQGSAASALLGKEFKRFTASPNYMLNCGLGIIMMPLCGAALLWKGQTIFAVLDEVFGAGDNFVTVLLCSVLCVLISMNDMTAPSVSLEGKSLWLLQSLPIRPWQVLRAKLSVQLILTAAPAVICILCACIAYSFTALQLTAIILVPLLFVVLSTLLGLFLGLKMPNLTWTNEIMPIKQSVSVLLALFSGTVYAALLTIGYLMFGHALSFVLYMGCFAALSLILSAVLYLWLKKKGTAVFAAL